MTTPTTTGLLAPPAAVTPADSEPSACPVDTARRRLAAYQAASCGLCVACREGAYQAAAIVADATTGKSRPGDADLLAELAHTLIAGSLCDLGRDAGRAIAGLLADHAPDIEAHRRKRCPAGVCAAYLTFHILPGDCTGCTDCLDLCPEEAIEGRRGFVHVIDQAACTQCGTCLPACPAHAIVTAGPVKPRTPAKPVRIAGRP